MANKFSLITKYLTKALDSAMVTESKTAILERNDKFIDYDVKGANEVRIAKILMDGFGNYGRANSAASGDGHSNYNGRNHGDGYPVGNVGLDWETRKLAYDRGKQFQIDDMDDEETAGILMGSLLSEFLKTQAVPEIDACRFGRIAGATNAFFGNRVTETPNATKGDASEITHLFNKAFKYLTEHGVPDSDQVIFVSPDVKETISNTQEIYKHLTQAEYTSEKGVQFTFDSYLGRPIIEVPSDRFFDKVEVTDNGYIPAPGSHVLNYVVCSKKAVSPIVKLNKSRIFGPDVNQDFDGYKANLRLYHDCFIADNASVGIYASVSTVDGFAKGNLVNVALEKTSTKATYLVTKYVTTPAGKLGTLIHKATAFTLGATDNSSAEVKVGGTFVAAAATEYFAVKDANNVVIATGKVDGLSTN